MSEVSIDVLLRRQFDRTTRPSGDRFRMRTQRSTRGLTLGHSAAFSKQLGAKITQYEILPGKEVCIAGTWRRVISADSDTGEVLVEGIKGRVNLLNLTECDVRHAN